MDPIDASDGTGERELERLTPLQARFIDAYVAAGMKDATAVYKRINPACTNAGSAAAAVSRMLAMPSVKRSIANRTGRAIDEIERRTGIGIERVVAQIGRLAFHDVRRLLGPDGAPLPLDQLDDDTAAAISGVDIGILTDKEGNVTTRVLKYKLADKSKALDMLMQHLNGYKAHQQAPLDPLVQLLKGMKRSAIPIVSDVEYTDSAVKPREIGHEAHGFRGKPAAAADLDDSDEGQRDA